MKGEANLGLPKLFTPEPGVDLMALFGADDDDMPDARAGVFGHASPPSVLPNVFTYRWRQRKLFHYIHAYTTLCICYMLA